ncbi:MAG: hypothetical protein QXJ36_01055 [Desulfurococcaceae archaeon]
MFYEFLIIGLLLILVGIAIIVIGRVSSFFTSIFQHDGKNFTNTNYIESITNTVGAVSIIMGVVIIIAVIVVRVKSLISARMSIET